MPEPTPGHIINSLQYRWKTQLLLYSVLLSLAITLPVVTCLHLWLSAAWWYGLLILGVIFIIVYTLSGATKITDREVTRYLNKAVPQLEESADLLLQPFENLSLLQSLQVEKISVVLQQVPVPRPFNKKLQQGIGAVLLSAAISMLLLKLVKPEKQFGNNSTGVSHITTPENVLPQIKEVSIDITPPLYTGKPSRTQQQFNLQVEEGAVLKWQITTSKQVLEVQLILNDSINIPLHTDKDSLVWSIDKITARSGFYQVKLADTLSELYKLEVIKDEMPAIAVLTPKSYTVVDFGQPAQVPLKVALKDDYGIVAAEVVATIASGSGEGVKFKESKLAFDRPVAGAKEYELYKLLDLPGLGLHPGDELYFYIRATDNHQQSAVSDMFIVSLPDTAQLMSFDGMVMGTDIKPEFFRSQRQIIIETEQLLKAKDTLTDKDFNNKCNDLGIDQKLLRLRYGKFLGEESETNIGDARFDDEHDGHDHGNEQHEFGDAKAMLDAVTHKHDQAEDATFFEPAIKNQLKATLTEMWNAELRLRTYKPREALPYEYKALRLLKELQQQSRTYVAKTGVKTTPLKPEKRLTGDLSKVISPSKQQQWKNAQQTADMNRVALGMLTQLKEFPIHSEATITVLENTTRVLAKAASAKPALYLQGYQCLLKVVQALKQGNVAVAEDIDPAGKALQQIITDPPTLPQAISSEGVAELTKQYFKKLKADR